MAPELPPCGLYRAGRALAGHEEGLPVGVLVYFHNHSDQGPPVVLLPDQNEDNRWTFRERGWLVEDPAFIRDLLPLRPEGLYVIAGRHLHLDREQILPERSLVQLGYNRHGDSILFPARFEGSSIHFPNRGYRFESPEVQKQLQPVNFAVPGPARRLLH